MYLMMTVLLLMRMLQMHQKILVLFVHLIKMFLLKKVLLFILLTYLITVVMWSLPMYQMMGEMLEIVFNLHTSETE